MEYKVYSYKSRGMGSPNLAAYARESSGMGGNGRYDYDYEILSGDAWQSILGYTKGNEIYDSYHSMIGWLENGVIRKYHLDTDQYGYVSGGYIYNNNYLNNDFLGKYESPDVVAAAAVLLLPDEFPIKSESSSSSSGSSSSESYSSGSSSGSGSSSRSGGGIGGSLEMILGIGLIVLLVLLWKWVVVPLGQLWQHFPLAFHDYDSYLLSGIKGFILMFIITAGCYYGIRHFSAKKGKPMGAMEFEREWRDTAIGIIILICLLDGAAAGAQTGGFLMAIFAAFIDLGIYLFMLLVSVLIVKLSAPAIDRAIAKKKAEAEKFPESSPADTAPVTDAPTFEQNPAPVYTPAQPEAAPAPVEPKAEQPAPAPTPLEDIPMTSDEVFERLQNINRLHNEGLLTDDEFAALKAKLLAKL